MARHPVSDAKKHQGRALGEEIRRRRAGRPASTLAASGGVQLDTWRRVEQGRVADPGFFLVADMAEALQVSLNELVVAARAVTDSADAS